MSVPDPDNELRMVCPNCGDPVPEDEVVSLTGYPDLCTVCADDAIKRAPTLVLWDYFGTPRLPHVECPGCGDADEVWSHFDGAGCYGCRWSGSLSEMRAAAALKAGEFALTFSMDQLARFEVPGESPVAEMTMGPGRVTSLTNPVGSFDWTQATTPVEDLQEAVRRARAETMLPLAPGVITDRQAEQIEHWKRRCAETSRLASPPSMGDQIAIVGVVLICLLAVLGVAAAWWVSP